MILLIGVVLAGLGVMVLVMLQPTMPKYSNVTVPRLDCAENMHEIGDAVQRYAEDHSGNFPDTLDDVVAGRLQPGVFVCPASHDVASTGATNEAVIAAKPQAAVLLARERRQTRPSGPSLNGIHTITAFFPQRSRLCKFHWNLSGSFRLFAISNFRRNL